MVVRLIIDVDSIIYVSAFAEDLESAKESLDSRLEAILDYFEENHEISSFHVCGGSRGNFRKYLTDTYKANRNNIERPRFLNELYSYCRKNWSCVSKYGVETDDVVATMFADKYDNVDNVIVSIDKDYEQFEGMIYNYNKNTLKYSSKLDALRAFYTQMIVGDTADNIKVCKGKGKAYAKKIFKDCKTEYQFIRRVFETYQLIYKSKARETYILTYKLLKLRTDVS